MEGDFILLISIEIKFFFIRKTLSASPHALEGGDLGQGQKIKL